MLGWKIRTKKNYNFWWRGLESWRMAHGPGKSLGDIPFHNGNWCLFPREIEAPWFAYWLHDKEAAVKEATLFQTAAIQDLVRFMPRARRRRRIFISTKRKNFRRSAEDRERRRSGQLCERSAHPVPYRPRPWINVSRRTIRKLVHMVGAGSKVVDNRRRADVEDGGAKEDCDRRGKRRAEIVASTTGTMGLDCEADRRVSEKMESIGKLSGFELMIAKRFFRGRYRNSFEKPEAIAPNQVTPVYRGHAQLNHVSKRPPIMDAGARAPGFRCTTGIRKNLCRTLFEAKMSDSKSHAERFIVRRNIRRALRWMCCPKARANPGTIFCG